MTFHSILAVADFSELSEHAIERAARLAARHQASLQLIHFAEKPHPFIKEPLARLSQRARQLARRHGVRVHALERDPVTIEHLADAARGSDLLVTGPLSLRRWATFYRGTALDQLLRACPCPLLVVRHPAEKPYAHVLVAVDLSERSRELVACARWLADTRALQLFHAVDTIEESRLRSADVSFEALHASRVGSRQRATDRLRELTRTLGPGASHVVLEVGNGDPAYQTAVQQRATGAELVVVGRRRLRGWSRLLTGSVAQRLARWSDGDVLIVPFEPSREVIPAAAVQG